MLGIESFLTTSNCMMDKLLRDNSVLRAKVASLEKELSQSRAEMASYSGIVTELRATVEEVRRAVVIRTVELQLKYRTRAEWLVAPSYAKAAWWTKKLERISHLVIALKTATSASTRLAGTTTPTGCACQSKMCKGNG